MVNSAETVSILGAQAYSPYANATFSAYTTPKARARAHPAPA